MSMSDYDLHDDEFQQRGMQPGTKLALGLIVACLAGGLVLAVVAATHQNPGAAPSPAPETPVIVRPVPAAPVSRPAQVSQGAASAFAGVAFLLLIGLAILGYIVLTILLLAWVARDARCRGLDSGPWVIALLMASVIGFLVYLASRPYGELILCANCGNKKLAAARRCPHCGQAGRRATGM